MSEEYCVPCVDPGPDRGRARRILIASPGRGRMRSAWNVCGMSECVPGGGGAAVPGMGGEAAPGMGGARSGTDKGDGVSMMCGGEGIDQKGSMKLWKCCGVDDDEVEMSWSW